MIKLHLVIGGMRSGKSRYAMSLAQDAERQGWRIVPIATALPADDEMRERILRHRADRPSHWQVIEVASGERVAVKGCGR
jgi:adenosylcobinamide kinase / adenosylcobinamide-phosphate guanylyltransferase